MFLLLAQNTLDLENSLQTTSFSAIASYTVPQLILVGLEIIFTSASILSFFFLLWGGVQWTMAGGDKEGVEKARKKILGALTGLALLFSAYAISYIIDVLYFGGRGGIFNLVIPSINGSSPSGGGGGSGGGASGGACNPSIIGKHSPFEPGSDYECVSSGTSCTFGPRTFTYNYDFWCRRK